MQHSFLNKKSLIIFIVITSIPIVIILLHGFFLYDSTSNQFSFSLSGFEELISPLRLNEILKIAFRAIIVCLAATTVSFLISYLLILYTSKRFQSVFFVLITLPFLANESVRVFSWQYVLSENGLFNALLSFITGHNVTIFDGSNIVNVYMVMIITCIPFLSLIHI